MWRALRLLYTALRAAIREWSGAADYDRYLRRCAARGEVALVRGPYFAQRLEERYRSGSRCC